MNDINGKMTSNYIIKNMLENPLEERKEMTEDVDFYEDPTDKQIDTGLMNLSEDKFGSGGKLNGDMSVDLQKSSFNLNQIKRSRTIYDEHGLRRISNLLIKK